GPDVAKERNKRVGLGRRSRIRRLEVVVVVAAAAARAPPPLNTGGLQMSRFPISRGCPSCGSKEYASRKPESFVAFAPDRTCKVCQVRYSPPTPTWGGVLFLVCGLALPVLGFVLTALLVHPLSILGLAFEGAICLFALVVFVGGIRLL